MNYLFLIKKNDVWTLATRRGKVLTVDNADELMTGSPVIRFDPLSSETPHEYLFLQVYEQNE